MSAALDSVSALVSVLAADQNNFGDTRGDALAGPLGLFIVVLLGIATVLLIRNMNKRLRRLPSSFPIQDSSKSERKEPESGTDETNS